MAVVACSISLKDATLLISAKLRWVCVERSRIRENSDAFHGIAPNSHESGYKETSRSAPSEV